MTINHSTVLLAGIVIICSSGVLTCDKKTSHTISQKTEIQGPDYLISYRQDIVTPSVPLEQKILNILQKFDREHTGYSFRTLGDEVTFWNNLISLIAEASKEEPSILTTIIEDSFTKLSPVAAQILLLAATQVTSPLDLLRLSPRLTNQADKKVRTVYLVSLVADRQNAFKRDFTPPYEYSFGGDEGLPELLRINCDRIANHEIMQIILDETRKTLSPFIKDKKLANFLATAIMSSARDNPDDKLDSLIASSVSAMLNKIPVSGMADIKQGYWPVVNVLFYALACCRDTIAKDTLLSFTNILSGDIFRESYLQQKELLQSEQKGMKPSQEQMLIQGKAIIQQMAWESLAIKDSSQSLEIIYNSFDNFPAQLQSIVVSRLSSNKGKNIMVSIDDFLMKIAKGNYSKETKEYAVSGLCKRRSSDIVRQFLSEQFYQETNTGLKLNIIAALLDMNIPDYQAYLTQAKHLLLTDFKSSIILGDTHIGIINYIAHYAAPNNQDDIQLLEHFRDLYIKSPAPNPDNPVMVSAKEDNIKLINEAINKIKTKNK